MAGYNMQIITQMMMNDNQFQGKAEKVLQMIKKLSTSPALLKLELDDSDFRKQIQSFIADTDAQIRKLLNIGKGQPITYKNAKGNVVKLDNEKQMKRASDFFLSQSTNNELSKRERDRYAELNRLIAERLEFTKELARQTKAVASGEIASIRQRKASRDNAEERAKRRVLALEKQIAREERKRARDNGDLLSSIYREIDLYRELADAAKKAGNSKKEAYANDQIKSLEQQAYAVERLNNLFGKQGKIMTSLRSLAARYFSIYTIANFAKKVAETTGYFQQQQVALEGILGSASKAKAVLNDIKSFALQSPFQTKDLVTFTKQLAAFGVDNNELFPTVKKLADISAGLGIDMGRIILAYGQVKSAAVLRGQELRQFTEAGIPLVQKLADKFTELNGRLVTTGEVFKLISERQVPFEMVASVLSDMTAEGGKFYKMQENITNTTYGQIQKLRDLWTLALDEIGKTSGGTINTIIKGLQEIVKNIQPIATAIAYTTIGAGIGKAISFIGRLTNSLKGAARWAKLLKNGLFGALGTIAGASAGIIVGYIAEAKRKAGELQRRMDETANSFDKNTIQMTSGLDSIVKKLQNATYGTKEYNDAISSLSANYGKYITTDMIKALQGEQTAAGLAADEMARLAASIKDAIKKKQDYDSLMAQGDVGAEKVSEDLRERAKKGSNLWNPNRYNLLQYRQVITANNGQQMESSIIDYFDGIKKFIEKNPEVTTESLTEAISDIVGNALEEAAQKGLASNKNESISRIIQKNISNAYALDDKTVKQIAKNAIDFTNWNEYDKVAAKYATARATIYGQIFEPWREFDNAYANGKYNIKANADKIDEEIAKESNVIEPLKKSIVAAGFLQYEFSDLKNVIDNANPQDEAFAYNIVQALKAFKEGEKNEQGEPSFYLTSSQQGRITDIINFFSERVGVRSGHAARIAQRFRDPNSVVSAWRNNENLKSLALTYGAPTDETYPTLRKQLQGYVKTLEDEIKELSKGKFYSADLLAKKQQLAAAQTLLGDEYYGIASKSSLKKGRNKYERLRIVNFFDDVLAMITKAEDASKKVAGVYGWTDAMNEFFQSLSPDNYMREFFVEGGTPFKKFAEDLEKYGVTEFLPKGFGLKDIETMWRNAGWEDGKTYSAPDFEAIYRYVMKEFADMVLKGMKDKLKTLEKDTPEYNSVANAIATLENMQITAAKNADTRWGSDEVQRKLDAAIKSLTNINSSVDNIVKLRQKYESAAQSGDYLRAYKDIYGDYGYTRRDEVEENREAIIKMLGEEASKGLLETEYGQLLKKVLDGNKFNISNLIDLLHILQKMREQASSQVVLDENGNPTNVTLSEQFKAVINQYVESVTRLTDSLSNEYNELMSIGNETSKKANKFTNAARKYADSLELINKAVEKGTIKDEEAGEKRLYALQSYYQEMATQMPDWLTEIYKDEKGTTATGITDKGLRVWDFVGNKNLESRITDRIARIAAKRRKEEEERYQKELAELEAQKASLSEEEYKGKLDNAKAGHATAIQGISQWAAGSMASGSMAIAIIDAIFKLIDGIFKTLNDMLDTVEEMTKAANNINKYTVRRERNGVVSGNSIDQYYAVEDYYKNVKAGWDVAFKFNENAQKGWEAAKNGDFMGAIWDGILKQAADLFTNIVNAQDQPGRTKQEALERSNENLRRAIEQLNHILKDTAGIEKFDVMTEQLEKLTEERGNLQESYDIELGLKGTDPEKLQDFSDKITQVDNEIEDVIYNIRTELLGTADELAAQLTDALVEAFRNGENAARSWRDAVRGYIGDALKEALMTNVIATKLDTILKSFGIEKGKTTGNELVELFSDPARVAAFRAELFGAGNELIDWYNNLPKPIQEMIGWNKTTSELTGGIQSITEDTARTLEGLSYSMLSQLVLIQRSIGSVETSDITQVQMSWFTEMRQLQRSIADNTKVAAQMLSGEGVQTRPLRVTIE